MKYVFAGLVILGIWIEYPTNVSSAQDKTVIGSASCSDLNKYVYQRDTNAIYIVRSWIIGFISGANLYGEEKDFLLNSQGATREEDKALQWVENYCAGNPYQNVATAAFLLIRELKTK